MPKAAGNSSAVDLYQLRDYEVRTLPVSDLRARVKARFGLGLGLSLGGRVYALPQCQKVWLRILVYWSRDVSIVGATAALGGRDCSKSWWW